MIIDDHMLGDGHNLTVIQNVSMDMGSVDDIAILALCLGKIEHLVRKLEHAVIILCIIGEKSSAH